MPHTKKKKFDVQIQITLFVPKRQLIKHYKFSLNSDTFIGIKYKILSFNESSMNIFTDESKKFSLVALIIFHSMIT